MRPLLTSNVSFEVYKVTLPMFRFLKKQELLSGLEINNIGADALMIHTTYPLLILTSISV